MTSPISMRKLLKLEMKQNAWMFALSALAQFMFGPVMFLLSINDSYSNLLTTVGRHCGFFGDSYFMAQIFLIILSICFTIFSYRYLFSKRMVDLYHSAPITRGKLFWIKYVHGFLVWFVPFVLFSIITLLLSFARLNIRLTPAYMGMITMNFLQTFGLSIFVFFIFYHLYLVAVYLSGNVLNMFANVAIIGFCVACLYALGISCAEVYFDTFCTNPSGAFIDTIFALSPFTTPFYIYIFYQDEGFVSLFGEHAVLMVLSLFISVLLLLLARKLCKTRPSELAERGTINKWYVTPAKLAVSFVAAIAFSLFFGELIYGSSGLAWSLFGTVFGAVLCYGAVNSIFHTTIKAFFKNVVQMITVTACGIVFILAFHLDLFGYDTYLPDKDQIAGVAIFNYSFSDDTQYIEIVNSAPNSFSLSYNNDTQHVTQENLLTDKDICYNFLNLAVNGKESNAPYDSRSSYYTKVTLKSGRTYYRSYNIYDSDYEVLKPFIESEEYKNTNYKLSAGLIGYPDSLNLYLDDARTSVKLSNDNIKGLMEAYWKDFEEHYTVEELASYMSKVSLEMHYDTPDGRTHYFNLSVPDNYKRTIDYLTDLYPSYFPYISSPDQILSMTPYMSRHVYKEYGGYGRYFGIEGAEIPQWLQDALEQESMEYSDAELKESAEVVVMENASPGIVITQIADVKITVGTEDGELTITDPKLIELIFPHLYFGDYHDRLSFRDYIYFADLRTTTNDYIPCYVKPNTVPQEIIDYLESNVKVEISQTNSNTVRNYSEL